MKLNDAPSRPTVRGRPSKQDAILLRERIHRSALREFRQHGYAGSSIDGIARAAAVSRTTIYALYTDKQTLFTEMIKSSIMLTDIGTRVSFDDRDPEIVLREALSVLNRTYHQGTNLEILRLFIAEADRFPALFEIVRDVLLSTLAGLVSYFTRLRQSGQMIVDDSQRAASIFNMLSLGSFKPLIVHQDRLSRGEIDGHLEFALGIFMRGCFAPQPPVAAPGTE